MNGLIAYGVIEQLSVQRWTTLHHAFLTRVMLATADQLISSNIPACLFMRDYEM